jgi:hypothetical protein
MSEIVKPAAQSLFETGTLVLFRVVDTHTELSPDMENVFVRAELVFEDDDEDTDPEEIVEWAALGFLFTLAVLSFHDARPRGISELDYQPNDAFTVTGFFRLPGFPARRAAPAHRLSWTQHEDGCDDSPRRNGYAYDLGQRPERLALARRSSRQEADCFGPRA